jgi:hypothetical protein
MNVGEPLALFECQRLIHLEEHQRPPDILFGP